MLNPLLNLLCILLLCFGCTSKTPTLKVAATSTPHGEILLSVQEELKVQGIDLEIITIEDYQTPNRALSDREIDANFFQHQPFLEEQIAQFHYPLEVAAGIHIEPLGAYSLKEEIPENGIIAIPNDPSNEARALLLLEHKGFITLKNHKNPTLFDVEPTPYKIIEVEAPLLPRLLEDSDLAIIPTNFAMQAKLKAPLFYEDSSSPYVNVLVIYKGDGERADIQALIKALKSPKTATFIKQKFGSQVQLVP